MFWIIIAILIAITIASWSHYRDVKCPAVLHNVFWILSLLGTRLFTEKDLLSESALIIVCVGSILFQVGFALSQKYSLRIRKINHRNYKEYKFEPKNKNIKLLIALIVLFSIPSVFQYLQYVRRYEGTFYNAFSSANNNLGVSGFFDYYRKIVQFIAFSFLLIYWSEKKENRKHIRIYVWIVFLIALIWTISIPTRNSLLFFVLPLIFIYLCTHNVSNIKVFLLFLVTMVGFMAFYYAVSLGKYWYLYDNSSSPLEVLFKEIRTYLSGSLIAFGNTLKQHSSTRLGQDTFRLFIAIYDRIFGTANAVELVNEFYVHNEIRTNVYTFYDFYLRDFGIWYALLAQLIVSIIHGASYKNASRGGLYHKYIFAMLSYPLVMQFFQDQYLSLLSTWIQIIIVGLIMLRSELLFKTTQLE